MISRRECLALAPVALAGKSEALVLENAALRYEVALAGGAVRARRFENKMANESFLLPAQEFLLELADGAILRPADFQCAAAGRNELLFRSGSREVRVRYSLGAAWLRKEIAVRGLGQRLVRADLENWTGVKRNWDSMHADRQPTGSHPVFCESLWAGVEFVAAFNEYGRNGFTLRSRPGLEPRAGEWIALHSTAAGVAEPGGVRDAFLRYIDSVRLAPPRWVACYNSWWTLPLRPTQAELLALAQNLKRQFYETEGTFFDLFAVDEGWTDPNSIWEIDRKALPNGFRDLRAVVEAAGGKLGLWMSPSAQYPRSMNYEWAARNGYVVLGEPKPLAVSLADPKYRERTKDALRRLIRDSGCAHIKYDGFTAREDKPHDGLAAGLDSVEPLAAYSLELIAASKEVNPDLVTEPTYMNSLANYISPWMIKYADTVWGNSGGDCPQGMGPAPDYRESATNAREYAIFASLDEVWLPQNALQYFDIVHCDDSGGFVNHAAMAVGRGRFFLSTYLNPKFMRAEDWHVYAGLLRWARANREILRETKVMPSRVEEGEPYCYQHWLGKRGVLVVRNPSNEPRPYTLDLPDDGTVLYTQFPYRRGVAADESLVTLQLAPWELLFLEAGPRAELREVVALGARWCVGADGRMSVAPDAGVKQVRVLKPGGSEEKFDVRPRAAAKPSGEVESFCRHSGGFELACRATVPADTTGTALLLVEYPGYEHFASECAAVVNSQTAPIEARRSTGHVGLRRRHPRDSTWTWYLCPLKSGEWKLEFHCKTEAKDFRAGLWLWTEAECRGQPLPVAADAPEMPQYRERIERQGLCLQRP